MDPVLPPLFDPDRAEDFGFDPDPATVAEAARRWAVEQDLRPAADDAERTLLLLIDVQKDFCFPEGSLYVAGQERSRRHRRQPAPGGVPLPEPRPGDRHDLDARHPPPHQIFLPSFWIGRDGEPLTAHRT